MRITKTLAEHIAHKESIIKYDNKVSEAQQKIYNEIERVLRKDVPKIPQELLDSNYIKVSNSCHVYLNGNRKHFTLNNTVPCARYSFEIDKPSEKIKSLYEKFILLDQQKKEFKKDLYNAVMSFTTSESLLKQLPELSDYFKEDSSGKQLVSIDLIEKVRKGLKK